MFQKKGLLPKWKLYYNRKRSAYNSCTICIENLQKCFVSSHFSGKLHYIPNLYLNEPNDENDLELFKQLKEISVAPRQFIQIHENHLLKSQQ